MRGETHFAMCECPIAHEGRGWPTSDRAFPTHGPHRIQDLEIHQLEQILRAPAFERSQYEFTRDPSKQRVGMAKPVPGERLAL